MSALTRILNNQIFNQTIIASQKIQPGSITGTLFASNVTVPGDFLITGNLFVLGSSQTTTIASTNTYVNDPLVVLNNGFAGSNTYDEGLIFNRGTSENQAFIWSEVFKEFRLVATSEAGTTYGNITVSDLANLSVRHFYTKGTNTTNGNINQTGTGTFGVQVAGNIALNGPYVTTSQGNISVFDVGTTQINLGGEANLSIGASVGTTAIRNATLSLPFGTALTTGQTTFSLLNTAATTINFGGQANITLGASGIGITTIRTSNVWVPFGTTLDTAETTFNLLNNPTTVTAFDSATTLNLGGTSGTATINNTTVYLPTATNIAVGGASLTFANTVVATVNAFGDASTVFLGDTTGVVIARDALSATGTLWANSSASTTTQGTGAVIVPNGGISVAGAANIGSTVTVAGATQLNSTLGVGGITTFTNSTNATSITDGAVRIQGGASVLKDLYVGGNLYAANIVGITANVITVEDPLLYLQPSYTFPYNYDIGIYSAFTGPGLSTLANVYQHTGIIRHQETNTWTFASNLPEPGGGHIVLDSNTVYDPIKAGNLELTVTTDATSATTGALIVAGGAGIGGNIFHTGTRLETSATNYLFASTPTTVDAFKAATDLEFGATSGTLTINNPTVVGTQTTQALYNTVTDTLNFARAANITMGHTSGITTLQGAANIQAVTTSTNSASGALKVMGGVGVVGNLNIAGDNTGVAFSGRGELTIGLDVASGTLYPENLVQFTSNANSFSRVSVQNISTQQTATSEFIALTSNGSNTSGYITTGIAGINFNSVGLSATLIRPGDGYVYTAGGNLIVSAASGKDLQLTSGLSAAGVIISGAYANVGIQPAVPSSSETTGALTTVGGVGIGTNLYVGKGATINSTNGIEGFTVKSNRSGNVAIFANVQGLGTSTSTTESVIIGGGNLTLQPGAILKVGGSTSMMVPVGPTGARPSSQGANDVAGMLRFNTTTTSLEFYDGTDWNIAGSVFTVISGRQFAGNTAGGFGNVDGTNTNFTLQADGTTAGTIISINGVMQFPTLAYSVTGNVLTFTEPPAPGDVIDARILTTTASVSSITNGNGINQLIADDSGTAQWSGTSDGGTVRRTLVDTAGDFNLQNGTDITYNQTAVNIAANNTPYVIATRSQTTFTSAKYIISAKRGTGATGNVETYEAQVITDGDGNAYISTYGVTNNGYAMGVLSANVLAGNVQVYYTGVIASSVVQANVKCFGTYIL